MNQLNALSNRSLSASSTMFLGIIILLASRPRLLGWIAVTLRHLKLKRISRLALIIRNALMGCRLWLNPQDVGVALGLGLVAWSITSAAFMVLLHHLDLTIPTLFAFALYPLAMLAGAASMLPGGVGSTEIAITVLLGTFNVPLDLAVLAAIGIRCASLWFAVLCGIGASAFLEWKLIKKSSGEQQTKQRTRQDCAIETNLKH